MKHLLLLIAVSWLSACATAPVPAAAVHADGMATFGHATFVGSVLVTPMTVVEDSRCPINARCVWAGRLVLKMQIEGHGWHETADLILGQPYETHGAKLSLVSAELGRLAGSPTAPPASLFGFEAR